MSAVIKVALKLVLTSGDFGLTEVKLLLGTQNCFGLSVVFGLNHSKISEYRVVISVKKIPEFEITLD